MQSTAPPTPKEPTTGGDDGPPTGRRRGRRVLRALGRGLAFLLAFLAVPTAVWAAGALAYGASKYTPPEASTAMTAGAAVSAAAAPAHDPDKPTAVVVVGNAGANIADTLPTYEVLASTGAFNLYTVAPERRPLPLNGGLILVPDLSFAELHERLAGSVPDVTVVPDMPDAETDSEESDAQVTTWLRETTSASDGLVLGVCTGARLLAEAGLLDGREATSHWYRLARLQRAHPEVNRQRGTRYIDTGQVITTGGLLSGIDGTLRVIERLIDPAAAQQAAQAVGWPHYTPGGPATLPESRLTVGNALLSVINAGFRWDAPNVGVVLTDGVGELELASAFDPWVEQPSAARTLALAPGGGSVRSRHGLTFLPRADLAAAAGRVDRLLIPGADTAASPDPEIAAAGQADVPVTYLHDQPGFAFDAALREVARTLDAPTARWAAKVLEYPTDGLDLSGPGWPWAVALRPILLGVAGLGVALGAGRLIRLIRRRRAARRDGGHDPAQGLAQATA